MANPVISSVTFDKSTYNVGDPITATVLYHDSNVHTRSTSGPSVVQHASNSGLFSSGTSGTVAVTITAPAAGNCLVAVIGAVSGDAAPSVTSVKTGTAAENWAQAIATTDPDVLSTIWTDAGTTSSATTVNVVVAFGKTAAAGDQASVQVDVYEVANAASFSVVDASAASAPGNDSAAWSSGATGTTVQPNEITFGAVVAAPDAGGTATLTGPSGWTNEPVLTVASLVLPSGTFSVYQVSGYQPLTATGSVTYAGTITAASFWQSCAVTLKAAPASAASAAFSLRKLRYSGALSVSGAAVSSNTLSETTVTSDQVTAASGVASSTHSFSPAAGSLVVVPLAYLLSSAVTATVTVKDSLGTSYTVLQHQDAFGQGVAAIATHVYPAAPGAITVKVTCSNTALAADCVISPRILTGQAAIQTGAGSVTGDAGNTFPPTSTTDHVSITTTAPNSLVYIATEGGPNRTLTASAGTTSISTWNDASTGATGGTGRTTSVTGTPGATSVGWTTTAGLGWGTVALEILPASIVDTPVTSDQVSAVSGVATSTHSFSPGAGSLVVVPVGYMFSTNITATLTVKDSSNTAYTVLQHQDAFGVGIAAIATHFYASAPGSITLTVTSTDPGTADCVISPHVITGQALDQSLAASVVADAGSTYPPVTTAVQGTITTTVPSSLVFTAAAGSLNTTLTAISGTMSTSTWNDSGVGDFAGTGRAATPTGTPGATTLGWTAGAASSFGFAALEVLPATGVTGSSGFRLRKLTYKGTGSVVAGNNGAFALRKLRYSGTLMTGVTSSGTFTLQRLGVLGSNATTFPAEPIGILVELNVNGTWTDITDYVYMRDSVNISGIGRPNEGSSLQAGQCTLTLNNGDGRFSPKNASGAYYPYVQRNTQMRVSVSSTTSAATAYAGYRFCGEVSEWPPTSDTTASDQYAPVTASGVWRRLSRLSVNIGSAYTRYCNTLSQVAGYWPGEDGSGSLDLASGVLGDASMIFTTGTPNLAATASFPGSNAVFQLNGAVLTGTVSTSSSPGVNRFRFLVEVPSTNDTGVAGGSVIASLFTSGTVARVDVSLGPAGGGPFLIQGFGASGFQTFTGPSSSVRTFGVTILAEVSLVQSAGNVNWALNLYQPGGTSVYGSVSGSLAGTVDDVTSVVLNPGGAYQNTACGQAIVLYSSPPLATAAQALNGWAGETAIDRFTRICAEEGIGSEVTGGSSVQMGPQFDGTLPAVLQTIEDSDQGFLYETRDQLGLGYRAYNSMVNQVAAVTLNYSSGILTAVPAGTYDDQQIVNDVVINNYDGYSYRLQLVTGAMSILAPPNGVGDYPAQPLSTNLFATGEDVAVAQVAKRVLNPGVVDQVRIPNLTVNLAKAEAAPQFAKIAGLFVGDYVAVSSPPSWLSSSGPSKQLAIGYAETFSNFEWSIVFNTIPETGYESSFNPGSTVGGRSTGSPVTGGQAGSVSGADIGLGAIGGGALSTSMSASVGGITTSVGPTQPVDPNTGDLWINTLAGEQINRFDGTNWIGIVFNAADVLEAQSITAAQIQAETITASLLAAGIVIAGAVDATTITGASLVAAGSSGEFLAYSGTPAAGNLEVSISATAGPDGRGNNYKQGLWVYDTGGNSMGFVPGGASAASQLALSTGNGTPTPPAGAAALYGAGSGTVQIVDGADLQTYGAGRRSVVSGTGTVANTGVWQVIQSSNIAAPGAVANRSYRVHGLIYMTPSATIANSFNVMWTGPGSISGLIDFRWFEGTGVWSIGGLAPNSRGTAAFTPSSGTTYVCTYDGVITIPGGASGPFEVRGTATSGESPWGVSANGFIDVMPV